MIKRFFYFLFFVLIVQNIHASDSDSDSFSDQSASPPKKHALNFPSDDDSEPDERHPLISHEEMEEINERLGHLEERVTTIETGSPLAVAKSTALIPTNPENRLTQLETFRISTDARLQALENSTAFQTGGMTTWHSNVRYDLAHKVAMTAGVICWIYYGLSTGEFTHILAPLNALINFYVLVKFVTSSFKTNTPMARMPPPQTKLLKKLIDAPQSSAATSSSSK